MNVGSHGRQPRGAGATSTDRLTALQGFQAASISSGPSARYAASAPIRSQRCPPSRIACATSSSRRLRCLAAASTAANFAELKSFGKERISGIRAMLRESTACSFGLNRARVVAGVHSFGVAVSDPVSGAVLGSVLMSGPPERLPLEHMMRILPQLRQFADDVGRRWASGRGELHPEAAPAA